MKRVPFHLRKQPLKTGSVPIISRHFSVSTRTHQHDLHFHQYTMVNLPKHEEQKCTWDQSMWMYDIRLYVALPEPQKRARGGSIAISSGLACLVRRGIFPISCKNLMSVKGFLSRLSLVGIENG